MDSFTYKCFKLNKMNIDPIRTLNTLSEIRVRNPAYSDKGDCIIMNEHMIDEYYQKKHS